MRDRWDRCRALLSAALLAAGALVSAGAGAAEYSYRTNERDEVVMRLSGRLTSIDGAVFLAEVRKHEPRIIELEGPGGDMLSAVRQLSSSAAFPSTPARATANLRRNSASGSISPGTRRMRQRTRKSW